MKTFKPASTNENKGYKTHGSFKHDNRNKPGTPGAKAKIGNKAGTKYAKEKLGAKDPVQAKLRKISKALFFRKSTSSPEGNMRAQLNG